MMPGRNAFDTSVETVVKDSLRALARGRARVFPGHENTTGRHAAGRRPSGADTPFHGQAPPESPAGIQ